MTKEDIDSICQLVRRNLQVKGRIFFARKKIIESALNSTPKRKEEPQFELINSLAEWMEPWQGKCPK